MGGGLLRGYMTKLSRLVVLGNHKDRLRLFTYVSVCFCSIDPGGFNSRSPIRKRSASFRKISKQKRIEGRANSEMVSCVALRRVGYMAFRWWVWLGCGFDSHGLW